MKFLQRRRNRRLVAAAYKKMGVRTAPRPTDTPTEIVNAVLKEISR